MLASPTAPDFSPGRTRHLTGVRGVRRARMSPSGCVKNMQKGSEVPVKSLATMSRRVRFVILI